MINALSLLWIVPVSFVAGMIAAAMIEAFGRAGQVMFKWENKQ